jgi:hypothetical protein
MFNVVVAVMAVSTTVYLVTRFTLWKTKHSLTPRGFTVNFYSAYINFFALIVMIVSTAICWAWKLSEL